MMDVNGHYEQRRQHYQDLLQEAEEQRLARELGFNGAGTRRSSAAGFWGWLSRILSSEVPSSHECTIRHTPYGG
jgi:hypothetical protein